MFQYVLATLDDDHGISETAYKVLVEYVANMPKSDEKKKILELMETVEAVDGRFFLAK